MIQNQEPELLQSFNKFSDCLLLVYVLMLKKDYISQNWTKLRISHLNFQIS